MKNSKQCLTNSLSRTDLEHETESESIHSFFLLQKQTFFKLKVGELRVNVLRRGTVCTFAGIAVLFVVVVVADAAFVVIFVVVEIVCNEVVVIVRDFVFVVSGVGVAYAGSGVVV